MRIDRVAPIKYEGQVFALLRKGGKTMDKKTVMKMIETSIDPYLTSTNKFTGQLQYTIHCRDGGAGKVELFAKQSLPIPKQEDKIIAFAVGTETA